MEGTSEMRIVTLDAAQVAVEGASMGPWRTVVAIAHIAFGIVTDHRNVGSTLDGEVFADGDG